MSAKSTIAWTEATWNPITGCSHVSPGCDNCYAARYAIRNLSPGYAGLSEMVDGQPRFTGEIRLREAKLDLPLRWRDPKLIFVNSMSDLFHIDVPVEFIADVFAVMSIARRHTFQVLTKRHARLPSLLLSGFPSLVEQAVERRLSAMKRRPTHEWEWPLRNVELGVSIESDRYAFRVRDLAAAPARVRWVSAEPLIGPVPSLDLTDIDWVVVGCESGPGARPLDLEWVRALRDECRTMHTAFFVKQLTNPAGGPVLHLLDEFPSDLRIRQVPFTRRKGPFQ